MAFDAFYLSAVLGEIRSLGEARIEKIHQPSRDTVILHLKSRDARAKLLIAANPAAPRLHLTTANPEKLMSMKFRNWSSRDKISCSVITLMNMTLVVDMIQLKTDH